jgi:uncharacterized membrane protein
VSLRDRVAKAAVPVIRHLPGRASKPQTLTIARPIEEVVRFWQDPANLTNAFDGIATVTSTARDHYRWVFEGVPGAVVDTSSDAYPDSLEFDSVDGKVKLRLAFAKSPLGTEVTMTATTPLPSQIASLYMFHALYRARALLQTGEAPTLRGTGDARANTA